MTSSQALWAFAAIFAVQAATDFSVLTVGRREAALLRWLPFLISAAAGVLLATACLDLLPEATRTHAGPSTWGIFLASLLALFCLQALAGAPREGAHMSQRPSLRATSGEVPAAGMYPHAHSHGLGAGSGAGTGALLLGSALHSTVDGVAIAAAFAAGHGPGWSAAIAVALHEMPHRLGDFSLLLHRGVPRRSAAQLAIGAGATAFIGGLVVFALGHYAQAASWLLPVSAASFLYIALVDLVPELQSRQKSGRMWGEIACLLGGAALIAVVIHLPGE